jgi:hypothetical protein
VHTRGGRPSGSNHHGHFDRVLIIRVDSAFRVDEIIRETSLPTTIPSSRDPSSEITALTAKRIRIASHPDREL